ncbi:nuclear transport factor 2 family protein [Pelagibacterium xiamenense]|uniref:nuclear transport factor 2 family protein n=1 Tax=Pelagibacterium xiamenense TaxID=2901140 RepID=UPI001E39FAE4|nr:nuclear transport factor 2 family protein [Pelagibacterium xiamenense]MCD7059269.1 nuclear transport factor 2 family protein [Pelagibacterium xiamenense]
MTDGAILASEYWRRMNTNRWALAGELFAPQFELIWPQSGEVISTLGNFVAINENCPAKGAWAFTVHRLIGSGRQAVSETLVSDGSVEAVAVSFFECADDKISRITEYWPDPFPAPEWRSRWVETMAD